MSPLPPYHVVSPEEVQIQLERGDAVCLVDVREEWEFVRRHISGALLLPLGELPERYAAEIQPASKIICVCEHGVRSRHAAAFLAGQGVRDVSTMTGGMAEYDGPVEGEIAEGNS